MRSVSLAVGLAALLLSSACSSSREAGTPPTSLRPDKPLLNTYWVLQKIGPTPTLTEANALPLSLLLKVETTNAQGNAGCNRFRGSYTRTGADQLTFSQLITTKMSCPQASTGVELPASPRRDGQLPHPGRHAPPVRDPAHRAPGAVFGRNSVGPDAKKPKEKAGSEPAFSFGRF